VPSDTVGHTSPRQVSELSQTGGQCPGLALSLRPTVTGSSASRTAGTFDQRYPRFRLAAIPRPAWEQPTVEALDRIERAPHPGHAARCMQNQIPTPSCLQKITLKSCESCRTFHTNLSHSLSHPTNVNSSKRARLLDTSGVRMRPAAGRRCAKRGDRPYAGITRRRTPLFVSATVVELEP
jgi:hypothetical protein